MELEIEGIESSAYRTSYSVLGILSDDRPGRNEEGMEMKMGMGMGERGKQDSRGTRCITCR